MTPRRTTGPALATAAAILVLLTQVSVSRTALNPDGVSYLDLAEALRAGEWGAFVQGYWSPLYPALIALGSRITGPDPVAMVALTHVINGLAAIAAAVLLWWWGRAAGRPSFAYGAIAALLLVSTGLPRIEAVTPDVLLLAVMVALGYELLAHGGQRWGVTGVLLGAAFLVKTSAWPWLLLTVPLRLWGARDSTGSRDVLRSTAVAALVMSVWIVPMSLEAGHPTLGSSGRLNYGWYLESSDSRSPDTHLGDHTAYRHATLPSSGTFTWVEFPGVDHWTYAPWSDPTAWDQGLLTRRTIPPTFAGSIDYWGRLARVTVGHWLLPLILGVLLPCMAIQWGPGASERLRRTERSTVAVAALGLVGVLQFILIHSEPRLIAPYAMLVALALLHGTDPDEETGQILGSRVRRCAVVAGLVVAAGYAVPRIRDGISSNRRIDQVLASIRGTQAALARDGISGSRIVIIGAAMPAEEAAYMSGAHIAAQVPPRSVGALLDRPPAQLDSVLTSLFGAEAQVAWITTREGGVRSVMIAPPRWGP